MSDALPPLRRRAPAPRVLMAAAFVLLALFGIGWLGTADKAPLREAKKREAEHKELRVQHWMARGFRSAAWIGAVIGLAGAAACGWPRKSAAPSGAERCEPPVPPDQPAQPAGRAPHRRFWLALAGLVLVAAWFRVPRLGHSLWNDEAYAARAYVVGVWDERPDGPPVFKPADWKTALFYNEKGNNHVWCSLEARVALRIWQKLGSHAAGEFSETALRFPAFVWGLCSIVAIGCLGRRWGGPGMGCLAAALLAVHPWHVRYSVEMRGYSAMLLASLLGLLALTKALQRGGWRWWLAVAAANLWALLAFAGSLWFVAAPMAAAAILLLRRRAWADLGAMVAANALAAALFFWLYGPAIPQLLLYVKSGADAGTYQMGWEWYRDLWSCLALGTPWATGYVNATSVLPAAPARLVLAVLMPAAAVLAGGWLALRSGKLVRYFTLAGVAAIAATLVQCQLSHSPTVVWYLLPSLLLWVLVLSRRFGGRPRIPVAFLAVGTLAYQISVATAYRNVPRQPLREAAAAALAQPDHPMLGVFGVSDRQWELYAPDTAVIRTAEEFHALEARATAAQRPLVIACGGLEEAGKREPALLAAVSDPAHYRPIGTFTGLEEMFSYRIYRKLP